VRRTIAGTIAFCVAALLISACGSPGPGPTPPPPPPPPPPANNAPVIETIAIQGSRVRQPPNFADVGESVAVIAKVRDDETAVEQLQYAWTATAGTFTGSGASVTWQAPAAATTPTTVTLTLTLTEKYGHPGGALSFEHTVAKSAALALHDSIKEVGQMSEQFLRDFSDTNLKDADYIMRNFGSAATCPEPREVEAEREDVIRNFTFFDMQRFEIGTAAVTVNFGGSCAVPNGARRGDACARVPVFWDSIDKRDKSRTPNAGTDIVAAAYSAMNARWFLCASSYDGRNLLTGARITR
jgi:hypothetical protein